MNPHSPMVGKMFGVTHDANDGSTIARAPRALKVGTGLPKGPAINVWLQQESDRPAPRWFVQLGYKDAKVGKLATRESAEKTFWDSYSKAPVCPYPRRLNYFTFSRPMLIDGVERYVPDFDAIEAHGPTPTKIDVLILEDAPLRGAYEMWSTSQLLCKGDGINAMRVLSMAATDEDRAVAALAMEKGEKYFPIVNGCKTCGCPYASPGQKNGQETPPPCKASVDFKFQVIGALRLGGTAFLHTTSEKSVGNLFGGLVILSKAFGHVSGIPLKLALQAWKSNHNGKPAQQVAYRLDFEAGDIAAARQKVLEGARYFQEAANGVAEIRLIDAPDEPAMSPGTITAEFYPEVDAENPSVEAEEPPIQAAVATAAKTETLAEKLVAREKAKKGGGAAAVAGVPGTPVEAAVQPTVSQVVPEDMF